ncbi:MAG: hypothetical protein HKN45_04150 [Flavobacteriales bacterium]|nr:hypothetical protein [Flavobacteriales bacterium]
MDITRQIHDAENSLREFIHTIMVNKHGEDWYTKLPKIKKLAKDWEVKKIPESFGHNAIKGEEKLIQYASIHDVRSIVKDFWKHGFHELFEDKETLDVYLRILADYRDPDSRRRELFIHQKHLLLGISGDLRTRIATWRSNAELGGLYSRIESVRDNFGNKWTPGDVRRVKTGNILKAGDQLEFIITAIDPEDSEIEYRCHHSKWQPSNIVIVNVDRSMVEQSSLFHLMVKSNRKHHAYPLGFDDRVSFEYEVLPS